MREKSLNLPDTVPTNLEEILELEQPEHSSNEENESEEEVNNDSEEEEAINEEAEEDCILNYFLLFDQLSCSMLCLITVV